MKIIINSINSENQEIISFENLDNINEIIKNFSSIKEPFEAKILQLMNQ